uniref:oxoglutarate dehydrogenase (succinyl-transferring) n=1 Tax=uncultured Armatimonadetes bacterium TaxID=157466 RepID=A0A6J4JMS9_9BACT|nr:2-oxoglutarate dehydrogenase E1 component [uncultured Armatimonadetes bacterium]
MDFHGPNAGYVLELYDRYQQDPASVDAGTRAFFERSGPPLAESQPATEAPDAAPAAPADMAKIVAAARIARLVREMGHLAARIDPLGSEPPGDPALELAFQGLEPADLEALPASVVGGPLSEGAPNAFVAMAMLRVAYSGSVGYEDDHIHIPEEREWLRQSVESGRFFKGFGRNEKRDLLERLTEVETFEQFLHRTPPYQGQKRFSIEGCDMLVPMLDAIVRCTAQAGTREVVLGMAHRGRLNVLAHVLGKPYAAILSEFPNPNSVDAKPAVSDTSSHGYSGDVKYHLGARRAYTENGVEEMPLTLAPNPSHLEFVDPVVMGRARAAQEQRSDAGFPVQNLSASLSIMIHGDAAFPGQGVVAETLNLSQLPGYRVGGTIHIIANNQVGFTTTPRDSRSTLYASDLAKGFEIPIVHVNADDPIACVAVSRMACAYRERFGKDFLIDLVGYRRWGHNEGDEPAYTQPRMYEAIRSHPTVREKWAKELVHVGLATGDEAAAMVQAVQEKLQNARTAPAPIPLKEPPRPESLNGHDAAPRPETAVPAERLSRLNEQMLQVPEKFTVNPKLERLFLQPRREAFDKEGGVFWAHAEALAFASILADGTPIRLTGQDSERGTFNQRNLVLHDPDTGRRHNALQALPDARATFALHNSPLSENAALGFEYGYSVHATDTLVLWEAQFGDFVNGAQVIVDQFIASGQAKWQQAPSLVLLLPHGYEGQGPEHSSGRLERFLQLCAGDNLRVVNCTTPAQYFHLLRRQAQSLQSEPRPLIVMTPKSLLRHPGAVSSLADLTQGRFQPVLDDPRGRERADQVTRLVLCSGKVYVDLTFDTKTGGYREEFTAAEQVAVARVEELNPFPGDELDKVLAGYPNLREVVWMQEEPQNMGAWGFVEPRLRGLLGRNVDLRYVGRPAGASPAEGSGSRHTVEQVRILATALRAAPPLKPKAQRNEVTHAR